MIALRIAHLLSDLSASSAASGVLNLMRWQQAQDHASLLIAGDGERLADVEAEGLQRLALPQRALQVQRRAVDSLCQQVKDWQPDVLHVHRLDCLALAVEICERLDLPMIVNIQRCVPVEQASLLREAPIAWLQVPNQAVRAHCINRLGIHRDRIVVLPFALTLDRIDRWQQRIDHGIEFIGAIGNFRDLAGFEQICIALKQMNGEGHMLKAMFMGSSDGQNRLLKLIRRYELQDHISLVCGSGQIGRFLSIMDALVYPASDDAMSVVIMKAMACRVPVIAPALGGIPELVHHDKTGILLPELNHQSLLMQLHRLILEPELMGEIVVRARQQIEASYATDVTGPLYVAMYENAVNGESNLTAARSVTTAFHRTTETRMSS